MPVTNYHVSWDLDTAMWQVKEEGAKVPVAALDTQEEALQEARTLRGDKGGGIRVHKLDGTFSDMSE